jgi:hypothetical protein
MSTLTLPRTADDLVGTYRSFGTEGPVYQVTGKVNGKQVHVVVVQTGEELDYPADQALADPEAQ